MQVQTTGSAAHRQTQRGEILAERKQKAFLAHLQFYGHAASRVHCGYLLQGGLLTRAIEFQVVGARYKILSELFRLCVALFATFVEPPALTVVAGMAELDLDVIERTSKYASNFIKLVAFGSINEGLPAFAPLCASQGVGISAHEALSLNADCTTQFTCSLLFRSRCFVLAQQVFWKAFSIFKRLDSRNWTNLDEAAHCQFLC